MTKEQLKRSRARQVKASEMELAARVKHLYGRMTPKQTRRFESAAMLENVVPGPYLIMSNIVNDITVPKYERQKFSVLCDWYRKEVVRHA